MVSVDLQAVTQPVGAMRMMAAVLTCMCFSLAAAAGRDPSPYWAWCMFTWCFCFFFTTLIVVLEFSTLNARLPFAWHDFTTAFAMLASLMVFAVSIIYPTFFACEACPHQIGASAVSWVAFGAYASEVVLTRLRPSGEHIGFLSTVPGMMKMLETFLACLIFTSLATGQYAGQPPLQWCVAVYSLCFVFAVVVILLSLAQLTSIGPVAFDKVVIVCNVASAVMYLTAMVMWPLYSFQNNSRPSTCGRLCDWDKLVLITFMAIFNAIVYTLDSAYSVYLVCFVSRR